MVSRWGSRERKRFAYNVAIAVPDGVGMIAAMDLAGISKNTIYADGRGPMVWTILKMCDAWGCTPNDLLAGLY